jgi:hypothetical protein
MSRCWSSFPWLLVHTFGPAATTLSNQHFDPEQSVIFTTAYRLVGQNQVSLGIELAGLALKAWTYFIPPITMDQLVAPLQISSVPFHVRSMDAGALQHVYCHSARLNCTVFAVLLS